MVTDRPTAASLGRPFPGGVPVLLDPAHGVTLRAHEPTDIADIVATCHDPEVIRWTTVPVPAGGYAASDAEEFLGVVAAGWSSGIRLNWAVEAERVGRPRFCGGIHLNHDGTGGCEVGFVLHPAARGRSLMSSALRLVRDYAFDVAGFEVIRWRALPGNWASRRVAATAGFVFDGTVRRVLPHRGELQDGWVATLTSDDPRVSLAWPQTPILRDRQLRLRAFTEADADRVVEACADPRTRHWLVSLPRPYKRSDALGYIEFTREQAARQSGFVWCIADPDDDRCLGSISLDGFGGYSRRAEIGYWAHPEARGDGVVTAAVRLVTAYAEDRDLVDSLLIRCASENAASRHVAEAAGYTTVGVLPASEPVGEGKGEPMDLVLYSRP